MEIKVYKGKIGYECWLKNFNLEMFNTIAPRKHDKIVLDGVVYNVIDIIQDYDLDEFNVFVEEYKYFG